MVFEYEVYGKDADEILKEARKEFVAFAGRYPEPNELDIMVVKDTMLTDGTVVSYRGLVTGRVGP